MSYDVYTRNGSDIAIDSQHRLKKEAVQAAQLADPDNQRVWIERIEPDLSRKRWYPNGQYAYTKPRRSA